MARADCFVWQKIAAAGCCAVLALGSRGRADDAERRQAAEDLQRHGLVRINGRVWGAPDEEQLRIRLRQLPALRERILAAQKELQDCVLSNQRAWQASQPVLDRLRSQISTLVTGDPRRAVLTEQLKLLEAGAVEPAELAGREAVREQLVRLGQDCNTLASTLLWIRRQTIALAQQYRQLEMDEEVVALIRRAGPKCRLGPARNYGAEAAKLEEYEKLAFAPHVPAYVQCGRVRVAALIADSTCVTLNWSEASDAVTYLPASLVHAAGIEVPHDAPRKTLHLAGRSIEAKEITLSSLRLGSCHAQGIEVCVLPPEAEDLGAQLSPRSLSPWRATVELDRLRLTLAR